MIRGIVLVLAGVLLELGCPARGADGDVWTMVNDNDPAASYSPGMQARNFGDYYRSDMHTAQKAGEWAQFVFNGRGVKWIGAKNVDHGQVDVYIDGKLDATVSTQGPTWIRQQDLYTKTGLPDGPHTLKVVVKTDAYQDFDGFAFYGPAPRLAAMPRIEGVTLPPAQPLLNVATRYPIGNGVAVAVCGPEGQIETVFGPGYTTSDLTQNEAMTVSVDGAEQPLRLEMKRAAGTGVFYGVAAQGDIDIGIVDFASGRQPWISRLIVFRNISSNTSHTVIVRDVVAPRTDAGYTSGVARDTAGNTNGFAVQADTSIGVPFGGNNPVDKSVVIALTEPTSMASLDGPNAALKSAPIELAPGETHELSLTHYFRAAHELTDAKALELLRGIDARTSLQNSITEWKAWFEGVAPAYALSRIKGVRARVLMEGALVVLRTNCSQDGGVVAHTTFYKEGYVRDAAMAIRGLLATGHTQEAKRWLVWIDRKLSIHGHLGDAMNCSSSLEDKSNSFDMGDMDVEEPGWVLLCARDYDAQEHDLAFLKSIDRTLRFCADIQLKDAMANGEKLDFNGDETEICGAVDVHATGVTPGGDAAKDDWSLSSVAMAAASLDFYRQYVNATGGDPAAYHVGLSNATVDLNAEVKKLVVAMDRDYWRTDVAGTPAGFHDFFRAKADNAWPKARLVNFTLMPVFFSTPYAADKKTKDVAAMAQLFDSARGFLQLVPSEANGMEGHDLGYLLWGLTDTADPRKDEVCRALVNGPTVDAWGAYCEAYNRDGHPNAHDLRSLETGVNVSALAKYWDLGK